ncbi:MAG: type secretion protein EsxA [Symbiobacteriaceae bacterium]|jgi:WXG100 family type VII secretion target|nr:type secretion protein EsxA [Symbiobacteriaceae bacterium]
MRIKITPEQIHAIASEFKSNSTQSQEMVSRLTALLDGASDDWEGMTKEQFYSDFGRWQRSMSSFVSLLENIGQQLDDIATRFESADQQ